MKAIIYFIFSLAIAICNDANAQGSSWSQPVNLTNPNDPILIEESVYIDSLAALGIDNNGNAITLLNIPQYVCKAGAHFKSTITLPNGEEPLTPIQLSNSKTGDVLSNIKGATSALAVDPSGNAVAIWLEYHEQKCKILLKASTMPAKGCWAAPTILASVTGQDNLNNISGLVLKVDPSGNATAAWFFQKREFRSHFIAVQSARLPFGGAWTQTRTIASYDNQDNFFPHTLYQPALAVDEDNNAVLTWKHRQEELDEDKRNNSREYIEGAVRKGYRWGRVSRITGACCSDRLGSLFNYDVALDSTGRPMALFGLYFYDHEWMVCASEYIGKQNEKSEEENLWKSSDVIAKGRDCFATAARETYPPAQAGNLIFDADDNAVAIWSGVKNEHKVIQSATLSVGECYWSEPASISQSDIHSFTPKIATCYDKSALKKIVAVWLVSQDFPRIPGYLVQASTKVQGFNWSFPANISPIGQEVEMPQIKMSANGHAVIIWNNKTAHTIQAVKSSPGGWSSPEKISATGSSLPSISMDASGNAFAIWNRSTKANDIIEMAALPLFGEWSSPCNLSGTGEVGLAQLAVNASGHGAFIWTHTNGGSCIVNASCQPCGDVVHGPICLSDSCGNAGSPAIAVDTKGNSVAVWQHFNGTNNVIQASTRQGNQSWTKPIPISASGQNADSPQVAVDSLGHAVAIWERFDGANSIIQGAVLKFGDNWSQPSDISTSGFDAGSPVLAMNALGSAVAVWVQPKGGPIQTAMLPCADIPLWMPPEDIAPGVPCKSYVSPQVKLDDLGNGVALWIFDNAVQAGHKPLGSCCWSVQSLTPANKQSLGARNPDLAMNAAGHAVGVWERSDGSFNRIECAYVAGNGRWSTPTFISNAEENAFNPSTAISLSGDVIAVWQNAAANVIEAAKAYGLFHFSTMLPPLPPRGFMGDMYDTYDFTKLNRVHQLGWQPSADGSVYAYNIYRNGELLTTVFAPGPYIYADLNRQGKTDTYEISAVSPYGESAKLSVTLY